VPFIWHQRRTAWLDVVPLNERVDMKSNVSDLLELMDCIYKDAAIKCTADVSDLRDMKTIMSRVKNEGLSFLTITLPIFARDFERALANGSVDATLFKRWKRSKGAVMPAFLQGFTRQIFDFETGKVLNDEYPQHGGFPNDFPTIVDSVRQLCLTFKKVELDCTPERTAAAFENFIATEQSFDDFQLSKEDRAEFLAVSSMLWDNLVVDFNPSDCTLRHGPGATAEGISGNRKYRWQRWHDRMEPYFPLVGNGYPLGIPADSEELQNVTIVQETDEQPVKVVAVPKTLKGPRIIAIEPVCTQYAQQGIRDFLYDRLESFWLTKGHINFRDQSVNQKLAITSSRTGHLATIDLSDASDRVPRDLALEMFRANPDLLDSIDACRSRSAKLPDGRLVSPLRKFASMGSALCFPVEAMYFYTICVVALLKAKGLSVTQRNIFKVSRYVYVYGDDIIVPSTNAAIVLDHLHKYNCKVNTAKTFWSGSFRESCGVDAFKGELVTPVYIRRLRPESMQQAHRIISWVATSNLFYKKGYWRTTQLMRSKLERVVGSLPYVSETSSGLGHFSLLGYQTIERWNRQLHRFEVKTLLPCEITKHDSLEGYGALSKCLLGLESVVTDSFPIKRQLELLALRGAVTLTRRWVPVT
jgi:hypothetical protein